jgi:hypothetical protein
MYAVNLFYSFFWGQRDESTTVGFTVLALLIVWGGLIAVGNWMERRHAAAPLAPSLGSVTRFPGMPRQMGELGRATVAKAERDAAVTDAATRAADVAVNVGIPAAVRMVGNPCRAGGHARHGPRGAGCGPRHDQSCPRCCTRGG